MRFVWNCGSKYIYGQKLSSHVTCSTLRTYTVDVSLKADKVFFADDLCGTQSMDEDIAASDALYLYIGADDDATTATWNSLSIWGEPAWDPDGSRSPSARPVTMPTSHPLLTPSPQPTKNLGPPDISDDFDEFQEGIWLEQCSGCAYDDGFLAVSGDSMLMRTAGTLRGIAHVRGTMMKDSR